MTRPARFAAFVLAVLAPLAAVRAGELRGSPTSMVNQHAVAERERLEFLHTRRGIEELVARGELVPIEGNADFVVDAQVPHRFARPEILTFLERLGAQYRAATGHPLVVTSLVRASAEQPPNAHRLSVHPAGMAVDFRVPANARHRAWLERTLLALEDEGVLDVTRERRPPHYHVAVFPAEYTARVAASARADSARASAATVARIDSTLAAAAAPAARESGLVESAPPLASAGLAGMLFGAVLVVRRRRERRRVPRS